MRWSLGPCGPQCGRACTRLQLPAGSLPSSCNHVQQHRGHAALAQAPLTPPLARSTWASPSCLWAARAWARRSWSRASWRACRRTFCRWPFRSTTSRTWPPSRRRVNGGGGRVREPFRGAKWLRLQKLCGPSALTGASRKALLSCAACLLKPLAAASVRAPTASGAREPAGEKGRHQLRAARYQEARLLCGRPQHAQAGPLRDRDAHLAHPAAPRMGPLVRGRRWDGGCSGSGGTVDELGAGPACRLVASLPSGWRSRRTGCSLCRPNMANAALPRTGPGLTGPS